MPNYSQRCYKLFFTYSLPLSFLITLIVFPHAFSTQALYTLKVSKTSYFNLSKYTEQYLVKSSMKVNTYLEFPYEGVGRGPIRYEWIRSNTWISLLAFPFSCLRSTCFPTTHPLHFPFENLIEGRPSTMLSLLNE